MRHAGPTSRELGVRTAFNLLGPLTNPAGARRQIIGVSRPEHTALIARALGALGAERAWVVHGAGGLDELSTLGHTKVSELKDGTVNTFYVHPFDVSLPQATVQDLTGGTAAENAALIERLLGGESRPDAATSCCSTRPPGLLIAGRFPSLRKASRSPGQSSTAEPRRRRSTMLRRITYVMRATSFRCRRCRRRRSAQERRRLSRAERDRSRVAGRRPDCRSIRAAARRAGHPRHCRVQAALAVARCAARQLSSRGDRELVRTCRRGRHFSARRSRPSSTAHSTTCVTWRIGVRAAAPQGFRRHRIPDGRGRGRRRRARCSSSSPRSTVPSSTRSCVRSRGSGSLRSSRCTTRTSLRVALDAGADIIGVNSRNLRTLEVHQHVLDELATRDSGFRDCRRRERAQDRRRSWDGCPAAGYDAFLIGERFMTEPDPGDALAGLLRSAGPPADHADARQDLRPHARRGRRAGGSSWAPTRLGLSSGPTVRVR